MGGRDDRLVSIYKEQRQKTLCQKLAENCYVSLFVGLTLKQYTLARDSVCKSNHAQPCLNCLALLSVAEDVLKNGCCLLSRAFRVAFPDQTYRTNNALERFLQMPLSAIRIGSPSTGKSAWYLLEHVEGVNHVQLVRFAEALLAARTPTKGTPSIDKKEVRAILSLAQSDRERELIRYSVFKSSGISATAARRHFGFQNMT